MMNQKLTELGCSESHFENPSGLNGDTQNVSAYDMAKIACAAFQNEKLLEISSSVSHEVGPTTNNPNGFTENPSGLNGDTQNVSAYDMAKIACAAFQNEKLLEISSSVSHEVGPTTNNPNGFTVRQEHRLVITEDTASEFYCPEAVAGKTGYLLKAGNTLVTYGEKDGRRLVSVMIWQRSPARRSRMKSCWRSAPPCPMRSAPPPTIPTASPCARSTVW